MAPEPAGAAGKPAGGTWLCLGGPPPNAAGARGPGAAGATLTLVRCSASRAGAAGASSRSVDTLAAAPRCGGGGSVAAGSPAAPDPPGTCAVPPGAGGGGAGACTTMTRRCGGGGAGACMICTTTRGGGNRDAGAWAACLTMRVLLSGEPCRGSEAQLAAPHGGGGPWGAGGGGQAGDGGAGSGAAHGAAPRTLHTAAGAGGAPPAGGMAHTSAWEFGATQDSITSSESMHGSYYESFFARKCPLSAVCT